MADSVRLSARLWIPVYAAGLPPVVLEYIPYRKRDSYRPHDSAWGKALARNGIAFVRVDVRGTGDSEGVLTDEYTEEELADGVAIIAWLAQQPWNNGRVGMRGISWGAINALQIAARRPAALRAILAIAGTDHRYADDAHFIGGLYGRTNLEWGVLCKSVLGSPPDPQITGDHWQSLWLQRLEAAGPLIAGWSHQQNFSAFWQRGSISLDYQAISTPVYVVAGLLDTYANPLGRLLHSLPGPVNGLLGCWAHTYPDTAIANGVDWLPEELRWWRRWLLDEQSCDADEAVIWCFVPEAPPVKTLPATVPGHWQAEGQWPPAERSVQVFFLSPGELHCDPAGEPGSIEYVSRGRPGAGRVDWLDTLPTEQSADDALARTFDSEPLAQPLTLLGQVRVHLVLQIDTPAAGIWVRLNELDEHGSSWPVCHFVGSLNRLLDDREPQPFSTAGEYEFEIPLTFCAHRFAARSRLRLALSDAPWPMTLPLPPTRWRCDLSRARMIVPLAPAAGSDHTLPFTLKSGSDPEPKRPDWQERADGSVRVKHVPSRYDYQDREVGTRLSGHTEGVSEVRADGVTVYTQTSSRGWRRGDWDCQLDCGCRLEATASQIQITEWLEASANGEIIFRREHRNRLPRELL